MDYIAISQESKDMESGVAALDRARFTEIVTGIEAMQRNFAQAI